jgi:drug/metabolite transporter (DMT)-like permease
LTFGVFLAVMAAALIHATWNALIKNGTSKQSAMLILATCQFAFGVVIAIWRGLPAEAAWLWLLGSGVIHMCYQLCLSYAYEHGDLSRVYPIARGAAPMMVLLASWVFLPDNMTNTEVVGVLMLGAGIVLLVRGIFSSGESRRMLPFALGSAVATAGYSITDGLGARAAGDPILYVGWLMVVSGLFYIPAAVALKGVQLFRVPTKAWGIGVMAGALSFTGYAIAVWAMTVAPIALVAALRETSILFAVLIGWLAFGERMDRDKVVAIGVILTGVILTRL